MTSLIVNGSFKILLRFCLAFSSVASLLALPICPPAALAANSAVLGSIDSRSIKRFATALVDGVRSERCLHLDLIVGNTSVNVGAQSSQIVLSPGSSIALSSAFAADSVNRSESSITTTR